MIIAKINFKYTFLMNIMHNELYAATYFYLYYFVGIFNLLSHNELRPQSSLKYYVLKSYVGITHNEG